MLSFQECNGFELQVGNSHFAFSDDVNARSRKVPVLVFTPDVNRITECHHIELNRGQARGIFDWLKDYLDRSYSPADVQGLIDGSLAFRDIT